MFARQLAIVTLGNTQFAATAMEWKRDSNAAMKEFTELARTMMMHGIIQNKGEPTTEAITSAILKMLCAIPVRLNWLMDVAPHAPPPSC